MKDFGFSTLEKIEEEGGERVTGHVTVKNTFASIFTVKTVKTMKTVKNAFATMPLSKESKVFSSSSGTHLSR